MAASFPGFSKEAMKFFRDLEQNNRREWFEERKEFYLAKVKAPMEALVEAVGADMLKYAPEAVTTPQKAMYRIYRDTRFSNDKTPYKTHLGASFFRHDLGKHIAGGFYFEVSHKHIGLAGGVYMPTPENLRILRLHLLENHERFNKLVRNKKLLDALGELQGDKLTRPPKGFPAEHPALDWIRFKNWYYWKELPAGLATTPGLFKEITTRLRLMAPVVAFFNEPLLADKNRRAPLETGWV
ncbi:MAG: DUF2461 domain-containing protein [Acidobacteria bacterium]|nr:DUF2461 domain-containing protein [Acidobacteriota bacterium]